MHADPSEVCRLAAVSSSSLVAAGLFALFLPGLVACGGGGDGGDIDNTIPTADAGIPTPLPDAEPQPTRMYVHTDTTLYLIDDIGFSLTEIGTFDAPEGDRMTDLAITPDGEIYTISKTALYRVDRETANVSFIANIDGAMNVGMTFLLDGTLLATDKSGGVRKIDPQSGVVTELGSFGSGYATAGDLVAVADGSMYAISDEGPMGNEDVNNVLVTIDPETGLFIESIGQIGFGRVFGSAVANNRIYAFTDEGHVIEINPVNGVGTLRKTYDIGFWGAGVTPRAVIE